MLVANMTAGIAHKIGQIYGTISVNQAIKERAIIFGNANPKRDNISNTTYTITAI